MISFTNAKLQKRARTYKMARSSRARDAAISFRYDSVCLSLIKYWDASLARSQQGKEKSEDERWSTKLRSAHHHEALKQQIKFTDISTSLSMAQHWASEWGSLPILNQLIYHLRIWYLIGTIFTWCILSDMGIFFWYSLTMYFLINIIIAWRGYLKRKGIALFIWYSEAKVRKSIGVKIIKLTEWEENEWNGE